MKIDDSGKMNVYDKIQHGYYKNEFDPKKQKAEHYKESCRIGAAFRKDVIAQAGLTNHKNAEAAFCLAYDAKSSVRQPHPEKDFFEVACFLEALAGLMG